MDIMLLLKLKGHQIKEKLIFNHKIIAPVLHKVGDWIGVHLKLIANLFCKRIRKNFDYFIKLNFLSFVFAIIVN